MRLLASILGGSVVFIVAFSGLWSGFVVQHHSYGSDSRMSQFGGTLVFFGVYLFPVLLAALLVFVLSTELALIKKKKKVRAVAWWRWLTWTIVAVGVLAGITSFANPELGLAAVACAVVAAVLGALVYERIIASVPKNERG
jgi:hypothetical protein